MSKKTIAIFIENNYQELEFWYPYLRLKEEGHDLIIIGPEKKTYKSKLGYEVTADVAAEDALHQKFDAVVIPGGYAPDLMRICKPLLKIVKTVNENGGVVAAICHAIWVLISAEIIANKTATCYHTIQDDLKNAGGKYVDQSVVVHENIITSRQPDDLPDFCSEIIKKLR
jgi:protease I